MELHEPIIHAVTPFGTAAWAFSQIPGTEPAVGAVLLLLVGVSTFYGFNWTIRHADDHLNDLESGSETA